MGNINQDMLRDQRKQKQLLEQTEVVERPGNISGFTSLYETGSFSPTWVGSTIAGTFTYTAASTLVEWSRIGDRVFFNGRIVISAIGVAPTGNLQIAGFPYAGVALSTMAIAGGANIFFWNLNVAAGYTHVAGQIANGASVLLLIRNGDNIAAQPVLGGELVVGDNRFEGHYRVA